MAGAAGKLLLKAAPAAVTATAAFLVYWGIRRALKKSSERKTYAEALADGAPENWANDFYAAFHGGPFGWGTDFPLTIKTVKEIPNKKAWDKTAKAYQKMHGRNLAKDVWDELDRAELAEFETHYNMILKK